MKKFEIDNNSPWLEQFGYDLKDGEHYWFAGHMLYDNGSGKPDMIYLPYKMADDD